MTEKSKVVTSNTVLREDTYKKNEEIVSKVINDIMRRHLSD